MRLYASPWSPMLPPKSRNIVVVRVKIRTREIDKKRVGLLDNATLIVYG